MKSKLKILHVEDSADDSELIQHMLEQNGLPADFTRIETRPEIFTALEKDSFDLILSDCNLPNFSGMRALEIAHALRPEIPFVFVSGTIGEETAIESLRNGATDYVLKDRLTRLVPAVRRALAEAEEKTMCRLLQQRLREAGRLEAISTLSNGIAHDFNNILTIILGHASLMAMEKDQPERIVEISETITEATRRGSEIVQQLLAFARKSEGHIVPADINRYIQAHMNALMEKLPAGVELNFKPARGLPSILADAGQIDRMLDNLIANSVDAMAGRGHITLSTALVDAREFPDLLSEIAAEKYLCLTVTDDGRGIDSTTRAHVFEPFFTTKERSRGTGLGLPVVYGLMQAHQGYIDVKSEQDEGTSVLLYFPVPRTTANGTPVVKRPVEVSRKGAGTILVVDDETDVRGFLETMLEAQGYQVISAGDFDEATGLFRQHQNEIQLVFSDIGLPKIDGIELCEKLRTLKPGVPLILASGYPTKEFKARINQLRPQAFLPKPYNMADILETVRRVLDGSEMLLAV